MSELKDYLNKDLYEVLNIEKTATLNEIKRAYRKLTRIYHPDINPKYEQKFKEIKSAYEILADEEKKQKYDLYKGYNVLKDKYQKKAEAKKAYSNNEESVKKEEKEKNNDNKKNNFSNILNDILDNFFENNTKGKKHIKDGTDITLNVEINETEALIGTNRTVNVLHTRICPKCFGKRFINGSQCAFCNGMGELKEHKKINVKIPPYIKSGSKIRIANEGNRGENGGKNGDLYLIVNISEKVSKFKFEKDDAIIEVPILPHEAILGVTIEIPSLDGKTLKLKIPPLTSSKQRFKLANEGKYNKNTKKNGDMIVEVIITISENITKEEIELYNKIKEISSVDIRQELK